MHDKTAIRIRFAMRHFDCSTERELAGLSDVELMRLPNFGRKSIRRLREITGKKEPRWPPIMNMQNFINRAKALYNIDGYKLADVLDDEHQARFVRDPVGYFFACDDRTRARIWEEVQKRAKPYDTEEP